MTPYFQEQLGMTTRKFKKYDMVQHIRTQGVYFIVGYGKVKMGPAGQWEDAVFYIRPPHMVQDSGADAPEVFARSVPEFEAGFTLVAEGVKVE